MAKIDIYQLRNAPFEAAKVSVENIQELANWCGGEPHFEGKASDPTDVYTYLEVPTLHGPHRAHIGDYVQKNANGRFWVIEEAEFEKNYELRDPTEVGY